MTIFHQSCAHYGRPTFMEGGRCIRSQTQPGATMCCNDTIDYGIESHPTYCPGCRRAMEQDREWSGVVAADGPPSRGRTMASSITAVLRGPSRSVSPAPSRVLPVPTTSFWLTGETLYSSEEEDQSRPGPWQDLETLCSSQETVKAQSSISSDFTDTRISSVSAPRTSCPPSIRVASSQHGERSPRKRSTVSHTDDDLNPPKIYRGQSAADMLTVLRQARSREMLERRRSALLLGFDERELRRKRSNLDGFPN